MKNPFLLLRESLDEFLANKKMYLTIVLVPMIISGVLAFIEPAEDELVSSGAVALLLILAIASTLIGILMGIALIHAVSGYSLDAKILYKKSLSQFLKYVLFALVLTVIVVAGFLLLIIPGIWLSVSFSFAIFYLLLQNASIKESLTRSMALVKGHWFAVFGRMLVLMLAIIAVMIVIGIIVGVLQTIIGEDAGYAISTMASILLTPFSVIYMYKIFLDLEGTKTAEAVVSQTPQI